MAPEPVLVWRFAQPMRCIASAPVGGGIGMRTWVLNVQVPKRYDRIDLDAHIDEVARTHACTGPGVGMLTAATVADAVDASENGVEVCATVGLSLPTWAADASAVGEAAWRPGTINVFASLPVRLTDAALVNAVMTVTEAKTQALLHCGVDGTGTASDAVCIACPATGPADPFAGPRSEIGVLLARATFAAVSKGAAR